MPDAVPGGHRGNIPRDDLPFRKLGPYEIQKKIGSGGMGTVYLAVDHRLRRKVALKVLSPDKAENQTLLRRFRAEAATAAQLRHENVVGIFDTGEDQGYNYITMEYIDGTDVQRLLDVRNRIPVRRSLEMVKQVAIALQHAEKRSIVHRDIKPANILITRDGVVKLADLGLARSIEDSLEGGITRAGMTVGTVDYMSPEQAQDSKAADTRSDIYSLGCTWFQMVTGKPPFPDGSLTNKLRDHAHAERPNPRDLNPDVPEGMVAVIQRMMAIKPQDRYQNAALLLKDLENPNILSDSINRKLFEEDRPSSEIPMSSRLILDDSGEDTSVSLPREALHRQLIEDDDETDIPAPVSKPLPPALTGKQAALTGKHLAPGGKLAVGPSARNDVKSQKNGSQDPYRSRNKLSRLEREDEAARSWHWRGLMGFAALALGVVLVLTGGIIWEQVKIHILPQESVVPQNLGGGGPNVANKSPNGEQENAQAISPSQTDVPAESRDTQSNDRNVSGDSQPVPTLSSIDWNRRLSASPAWIDQIAFPEERLPRFTVGPGGNSGTACLTLNHALASMGPLGGIIELNGEGPFPLTAASVKSRIVIIRKGVGNQPIVNLLDGSKSTNAGILNFDQGLVVLKGITFQAEVGTFQEGVCRAFVSTVDSAVFIRECGFFLRGKSGEPISAVRAIGSYKSPEGDRSQSRLSMVDTLVEGDGLTGLHIDSDRLEAVARHSLMIGGSAPAVSIMHSHGANADDSVSLVMEHCTLSSASAGIRLEKSESGVLVPTGVGAIDSVLAGQSDSGALVSSKNWAFDGLKSELKGPLREFSWYSRESVYTGWKHLLDVGREDAVASDQPEKWLLQYQHAGELQNFLPDRWPKEPLKSEVVSESRLRSWQTRTLPGKGGGSLPGCDVERLAAANFDITDPFTIRPVAVRPLFSGPEVRIDLRMEKDFGAFISKGQWKDGTTFVISGSGVQRAGPTVIRGISARIKFIEEGNGMTVQPSLTAFGRSASGSESKGLFQVEDGLLEIDDGKFVLPNHDRNKPQSFLIVNRGGVILDRCQIDIPLDAKETPRLILDWQGIGSNGESDSHPGMILDSRILSGAGTFAALEDGAQSLLVRNSLLIARDDLFAVRRSPEKFPDPVSIDSEQSTLVAGRRIFQIASPSVSNSSGLRIFADSCLYAGLDAEPSVSSSPSLLGYDNENSLKSVSWRETGCGYGDGIVRYLMNSEQSSGDRQEFSEWLNQWGANSIRSPLTEPGSVVFVEGSRASILTDSAYTLKKDCPAYRFGRNQMPIGVGTIASRASTPKVDNRPKTDPKISPRPKVPVPGL